MNPVTCSVISTGGAKAGSTLFGVPTQWLQCPALIQLMATHRSAMGIGVAKEGFSLFGVLNKCVTLGGRRMLRLWFARPMVNLAVLNDR